MMPFKVNADYEVELFHHKLAPPAINQSIEFLLFFISQHPLFSSKKYGADYLSYIEKVTGHKPQIVSRGPFENFWGPLKNIELEKWWNSKLTSTELILQKKWCPETHIVAHESQLELLPWNRDLLLKDPFGMSGQKFQVLRGDMSIEARQEIVRKALANGAVILEPWLKRKYDFSQYLFPDGKLIAYQNQVDEKFQYKGTIFNNLNSMSLEDLSFYSLVSEQKWAFFRRQTQEIIDYYSQHPNEYGYSIDSFIYEETGELKIQVMSEINYRRTMGRVTYELSKKIALKNSWSALLLTKVPSGLQPLWKSLGTLKDVLVLSPGDARFEIIFLSAKDQVAGQKLIEELNCLLPNAQFTIKF